MPDEDLQHVLTHTAGLWRPLQGQRWFLTGGSGFVGSWLLETFLRANDALNLGASAIVLTRDPAAFRQRLPWLGTHQAIELVAGDVRTFPPPDGPVSHVIHAAGEGAGGGGGNDGAVHDITVKGTRQALAFARQAGAARFLFVSSGAVYGPQAPTTGLVSEGALTPATGRRDYAEGKREAEELCRSAGGDLVVPIARGFAFVGPHLPLDRGFAVGNFIRDAFAGGPVRVSGDGTAVRSYLYAADMAIWLWHILMRGVSGRAYNVGSDRAVTIRELATAVAAVFSPSPVVEVLGKAQPGAVVARYVPSVQRVDVELGLRPMVTLPDALQRTVRFLRRPGTSVPGSS
jgi:dTDP-glucose 4,6-dehydratase